MKLIDFEHNLQNEGFSQEDIEDIKSIIHNIGIAENLAWRKKEGVLKEDISAKKKILKYLIENNIIDDTVSKYMRYPVYKLKNLGSILFKEMDLEFQSQDFTSFLSDFNKINSKMLCLIGEDNFRQNPIDYFDISTYYYDDGDGGGVGGYTSLLENSIKGDLIYKEYEKIMFEFLNIIRNYNYYYEITHFQSNSRADKRLKFINNQLIIKILEDNSRNFREKYKDEINDVNKKRDFFNSIEMSRYTLNLKIHMRETDNSKDFYNIVNNLSKENIVTPIQFDDYPYFNILEPKKYILRNREIRQEIIDSKTTSIIEFLLDPNKTLLEKPRYESIEKEEKDSKIKDLSKKILVFVSYSTRDSEFFKIKNTSEDLSKFDEIEDVLYWEEDMKDNMIKYMNDNLGKCDVVLLFCSPNALNSSQIEDEWTAADAMRKPIIPIFVKTEHIPPLLRSRLGLEFDTFNYQLNIENLYGLILRKTQGIN